MTGGARAWPTRSPPRRAHMHSLGSVGTGDDAARPGVVAIAGRAGRRRLSSAAVGWWSSRGGLVVEPRRAGGRAAVGWWSSRGGLAGDRKSTRLNSSHLGISYAVF